MAVDYTPTTYDRYMDRSLVDDVHRHGRASEVLPHHHRLELRTLQCNAIKRVRHLETDHDDQAAE